MCGSDQPSLRKELMGFPTLILASTGITGFPCDAEMMLSLPPPELSEKRRNCIQQVIKMYFCTTFKRDNLSKKAAPKSQRGGGGVTVRALIYSTYLLGSVLLNFLLCVKGLASILQGVTLPLWAGQTLLSSPGDKDQ